MLMCSRSRSIFGRTGTGSGGAPRPDAGTPTPTISTISTRRHLSVVDGSTTRKTTEVEGGSGRLYRRDYREPANWVTHVDLDLDVAATSPGGDGDGDDAGGTTTVVTVTSLLTVLSNVNSTLECRDLILDGEADVVDLRHISIVLDDGDDDGDGGDEGDVDHGRKTNAREMDLVTGTDYELLPDRLVLHASSFIPHCRPTCKIRTVVEVVPNDGRPTAATAKPSSLLSGLFQRDDGALYTHCEPTGFRRITYFPDRPDNTAVFSRVRIEADRDVYPVLLSSGDVIDSGDVVVVREGSDDEADGGREKQPPLRHYAVFADPHPKPCYLFAAVLASSDWGSISSTHVTSVTNRPVELRLYAERSVLPRLSFALDTLRDVMEWEERTYGLEYDIDTYTIVASRHFSIGAMENRGLNLFLSSLVATHPNLTTDVTYDLVQKTVAHEYLHNQSGNRVTVRDWFEFGLKEGLTVFRDREYTRSVGMGCTTRIEAVKILREKQFAEDAGSGRQPVRPESIQVDVDASSSSAVMDGLWTSTAYHKGAEVVGMMRTILGPHAFAQGLRSYFDRHDGRGATFDDLLEAMADVDVAPPPESAGMMDDVDWERFGLWYATPGTPTVSYRHSYDADAGRFDLILSQSITDLGDGAPLLHIPVAVGLLDGSTGEEVVPTTVLHLRERTETFSFDGLGGEVVPSILRDFSAPVRLIRADGEGGGSEMGDGDKSDVEARLAFLAAHDTDGFNRWEAVQGLLSSLVYRVMRKNDRAAARGDRPEDVESIERLVLEAFANILSDRGVDPASGAYMLALPTESVLARGLTPPLDPVRLHHARKHVRMRIGTKLRNELRREYDRLTSIMTERGMFDKIDTEARATRSLRNVLLEYICLSLPGGEGGSGGEEDREPASLDAANLASGHYETAECLTDRLVSYRTLSSIPGPGAASARVDVTQSFYDFARGTGDAVVMNKWFQTRALSELPGALDDVRELTGHPDFRSWVSSRNPGRFRSLVTSFAKNHRAFHHPSGEGYAFIGSVAAQVDRVAPPLAVELVQQLAGSRRYDEGRGAMMRAELTALASMRPPVSPSLARAVNDALGTSTTAGVKERGKPFATKRSKRRSKRPRKSTKKATRGFS